MQLIDLHNICEASINIKKPLYFDDTYKVFNLTYDDKFFLLKVPNIQLAETNSKFYSYVSNNFSRMHKLFDKILQRLSSHSLYKDDFVDKHNTNSTKNTRIKTLTSRNKDIVVFDLNGFEIDISRLFFGDKLSIIFNVKHVWINKTSYGVYFIISQILRNEPIGIKQNLFFDHASHKQDKYIYNDITVNNLLNQKQPTSLTCVLPALPPPPPPPPLQSNSKRCPQRITIMRPTQKELLEGIGNLRKINKNDGI